MPDTGSSQSRVDRRGTEAVGWTRDDDRSDPIARTVPYVELGLEHPDVEATLFGRSDFPAAVPYRTGDEARVFYWRDHLSPGSPPLEAWHGACATTHALGGVAHDSAYRPVLFDAVEAGHELVVDGTVAGDSTAAVVDGYSPPDVAVRHATPHGVELTLSGAVEIVSPGSRERFELPEQSVLVRDSNERATVVPELAVRFPGERTLYHPAPDGEYALFPAFGLDLDAVPTPVPVPTSAGELDHDALASALGVDLADRPYPERVLWQAFAHSAFDPHSDEPSEVGQFPSGVLAVRRS